MSKSGIEPLTHGFSVHRSTTELLERNEFLVHFTGIEPVTFSLEGYCSIH